MYSTARALRLTVRLSPRRAALQHRCLASQVINLSDQEAVEKFRASNAKSILYYTASWCGPCKMIKPIYEQLSEDFPDVAFGKVDVDENPEAAAKAQVSAVPTFTALHNDVETNKFAGADTGKLQKAVKELNES